MEDNRLESIKDAERYFEFIFSHDKNYALYNEASSYIENNTDWHKYDFADGVSIDEAKLVLIRSFLDALVFHP